MASSSACSPKESARKPTFAFDSAFSSSQRQNQQLAWEVASDEERLPTTSPPSRNEEEHDDEGLASSEFLLRTPMRTTARMPTQQIDASGGPIDEITPGGSSVRAAIFNFTNAIVGAGAIGLGGAFAASGGLISIATLLTCALLTKVSLDLVLQLSLEQGVASYEELGYRGFGNTGRYAVLSSKLLYSFGCLVAYVIVIKDNFAPAWLHLLYGDQPDTSFLPNFLRNSDAVTWVVSVTVILPLCLLRDMTPLAGVSLLSVVAMVLIVVIVIYLFVVNPNDEIREKGTTLYEDWIEIRWGGYLQCLGTFVFTFVSVREELASISGQISLVGDASLILLLLFVVSVSHKTMQQHMVHLAFASLKPELRTLDQWKRVSTSALSIASTVSLAVGVFAYMTFWEATQSDIFDMYPGLAIIDIAKLLLCLTMVFTYPLPFFACRELIIVVACGGSSAVVATADPSAVASSITTHNVTATPEERCDLEEPLLPAQRNNDDDNEGTTEPLVDSSLSRCLLPVGENQLQPAWHILLTVVVWLATTSLAVAAPNLGDCLSVVGCATGVAVAFLLPSLLALKLQGFTFTAGVLLLVGVVVGVVGTYCSVQKLIQDL